VQAATHNEHRDRTRKAAGAFPFGLAVMSPLIGILLAVLALAIFDPDEQAIAVLIVLFFVMPFFTVDLDEEIKTRRPLSRMRSGRSVKGARKKSQNFLKRRSSNA
jgi:hypothetical protein